MIIPLATLKTRLGIEDADPKDDALLKAVIQGIGARFEQECNRKFARDAAATFEFRADEMDVNVNRFPIEAVAKFELKTTEAEGWVETATTEFLINGPRNIIQLATPLGTSRQLARVTFAGGYVLPGDTAEEGQTELPADLAQAALEQCAYWYQNRDRLGVSSMSGEGGSIQNFGKLDLLPGVEATLRNNERWVN